MSGSGAKQFPFGVNATQANITKQEANTILTATIDAIMDAVSEGNKVTLVGFGTFEPRQRQAREGHNPRTGETMTIPGATVPAFSAEKLFKEKVAS